MIASASKAVLLLRKPVCGPPADLTADRRLGRGKWKGSRPQPHG